MYIRIDPLQLRHKIGNFRIYPYTDTQYLSQYDIVHFLPLPTIILLLLLNYINEIDSSSKRLGQANDEIMHTELIFLSLILYYNNIIIIETRRILYNEYYNIQDPAGVYTSIYRSSSQ